MFENGRRNFLFGPTADKRALVNARAAVSWPSSLTCSAGDEAPFSRQTRVGGNHGDQERGFKDMRWAGDPHRSNRIIGVLSAAAPKMERHDVRDAPDAADQIGREVKSVCRMSHANTINATIAYCVCWRRGSRVVSTVYLLLQCQPSSTPRPSLSRYTSAPSCITVSWFHSRLPTRPAATSADTNTRGKNVQTRPALGRCQTCRVSSPPLKKPRRQDMDVFDSGCNCMALCILSPSLID